MKKLIYFPLVAILLAFGYYLLPKASTPQTVKDIKVENFEEEGKELVPNDHWMNIRAYPFGFDQQEYNQRMVDIQDEFLIPYTKSNLGLAWTAEGPGNIGGRFNALAKSPTDNNIIYAGAANGGIFKTTDGGANWNPIFDDNAYLAVGEIELDPNDENTIYVG